VGVAGQPETLTGLLEVQVVVLEQLHHLLLAALVIPLLNLHLKETMVETALVMVAVEVAAQAEQAVTEAQILEETEALVRHLQ
jgi:hypothetical protein